MAQAKTQPNVNHDAKKHDAKKDVQLPSDQKKKTFDFKIAGVSYKLKTSHDEQTVNELVAFVDQRITEALSATKNASFQNAAVLAALNIAEEMILLKRRAKAELNKLENKATRIAQDLENSKANKTNWN